MARILYIEPYAGIAGDMFAGSVLGLLENTEEYFKQLYSLPIRDDFEVRLNDTAKSGISAKRFEVILKSSSQSMHKDMGRHLSEIITVINTAEKISDNAKNTAVSIFKNLAEAEASVHDSTLEKVHFHEVGAVDAIIDICSAAIAVDLLNVDSVVSAPVSVGTGTVKCCHGILPVPVPAVVELLEGMPINKTLIKTELTTPTGAAVLKTLVDCWNPEIAGTVLKSNYSAGTKDLDGIPNILRTSIIKTPDRKADNELNDEVAIIESNIDDYPGEHFTALEKALFNAGALDYILVPGTMKKSRPGLLLQVICPKNKFGKIAEVIFSDTTTNGIRFRNEKRIKLNRKIVSIDTPLGTITAKLCYNGNRFLKAKPEQEEVERIASESGKNYISVLNEINYYIQEWTKLERL
ncbi:MAG: nickel pincer cofactor biosynthesis protein LarC [Victivallales bacterium]|nr:nickel pincer cofactor biosynthesis protein LarC [Victivallales bacterium]